MVRIAIVGAGVSGLTCGVTLAEAGFATSILAERRGSATTSAAAAAIWYVYDVEPRERAMKWALRTLASLREIVSDAQSGVSVVEFRCLSLGHVGEIPSWAAHCNGRVLDAEDVPPDYRGGFAIDVPLMDTSRYLPYLHDRFVRAGGELAPPCALDRLEDVPREFDVVVNCSGYGARRLARDESVSAHRGQVVVVGGAFDSPAVVCEENLAYVIPRKCDSILGGTNADSDSLAVSDADTRAILSKCASLVCVDESGIVDIRVGIRAAREEGIRLGVERLADGRHVVHNYGHGGSGFTVSWGCAEDVREIVRDFWS